MSLAVGLCVPVHASLAITDGSTLGSDAEQEVKPLWLPLLLKNGFFEVRPAHPRDLEITLDATLAVSATLTEAGGVLRAVDASGTLFTLVLPPQALVITTTVRMTPIQAVSGLAPGVRFVAGVHLEPEGQQLFQLATLTISPTVTVPVTRALSFTAMASGQNAHTYPPNIQPRTPTFTIGHFSEYALSEVDPLVVEPDFNSVPVGDEAQFESALHNLFSTEHTRQLSGETPDPHFWDKLEYLMRGYFVNVILPLLGPIESDCAQMERNASKALTWARQVSLMFGQERLATEQQAVMDAYKRGLINCWDTRYPCANRHAPADLRAMYALARLGQLMGLTAGGRFDPDSLPDCQCVRAVAAPAWRGQISYAYQRATGDASVAESAEVEARLEPLGLDSPGRLGNPSGNATLHVVKWYGTTYVGGPIVPYEAATNEYSRMNFRIDPRTCTYAFNLSIDVVAQVCDSQGKCHSEMSDAGTVNSAYLPKHTVSDHNLILEGSGYFDAHGDSFTRTGYDDIFYPGDNNITDNGNLGLGFVTWRFWPLAQP